MITASKLDPVAVSTFQENEKTLLCSVDETGETDLHDDDLSPAPQVVDRATLLSVAAAKQRIAPEILSALADRFNGKLSAVRPVDEKDLLLNNETSGADVT